MFPIRDTIPSRHKPLVTWCLIATNLGVFVWQLLLPQGELLELLQRFSLVPARYGDPAWSLAHELARWDPRPLVTSQFLHGGLLHLVFNMWTLWIFGDNVEDRMGAVRFLSFYLLAGVAAATVHLATQPTSPIPTVGASGAIAGVLGAYLVLYPGARVVTLIPVFFWPVFVELPALLYLVLWFFLQLISGVLALGGQPDAGIAWWAHIGGFVAGLLSHRLFLAPRRRRRNISVKY